MKKIQVLRTMQRAMCRDSCIAIVIDGDPIPIDTAIRIWDALNEECGADQADQEKEEDESKEEPKKVKAPAKTSKRKVDDGKILALYKAGWSCPKIADEMGCSVPTVIDHLKNMGEYKKESKESA